MSDKIEVGILGATGMVGQQLVKLLEDHPWFRLTWLAASDKSEGRLYGDACSWRLPDPMPATAQTLPIHSTDAANAPKIVFSALHAAVAEHAEKEFARCGHIVVSNAGSHRMDPDVPLLIPEVNPEHLALIPIQQRHRGWNGILVTNPNCTTVGLAMSLAPLEKRFGLKQVLMTSLQAVSGAGYPGLPALEIMGNVIPYIAGEEEKVESETRKILGRVCDGAVSPADFTVSAHCNRVFVEHGHTESISVSLRSPASLEDLLTAWHDFTGLPQQRGLPSAPRQPIVVRQEPDRPQPKLDVSTEKGQAVVIGRLRLCSVLQFKFTALSHNTIRGAAGAALLNAELLVSEGYAGQQAISGSTHDCSRTLASEKVET